MPLPRPPGKGPGQEPLLRATLLATFGRLEYAVLNAGGGQNLQRLSEWKATPKNSNEYSTYWPGRRSKLGEGYPPSPAEAMPAGNCITAVRCIGITTLTECVSILDGPGDPFPNPAPRHTPPPTRDPTFLLDFPLVV